MRQFATGLKTTGTPHLGNIIGAIQPSIELGKKSERPPLYVVADMHSMLGARNPVVVKANVLRTAAAWMAFGATERGLIYRESRIPELSEIALLLSGTAPISNIARGSFEGDVFTSIHPLLMSANLGMLETTHVFAGQDAIEHLSIVQDTLSRFNRAYGNIFSIPEKAATQEISEVPGTDGLTMSRSEDNVIEVLTEPEVIEQIVARISEERKKSEMSEGLPDTKISQRIISAVRGNSKFTKLEIEAVRSNEHLSEFLVEEFRQERDRFRSAMNKPDEIIEQLEHGEAIVLAMARDVLSKMRLALGIS